MHPSEGITELRGRIWTCPRESKGEMKKRLFNIVCDVVDLPIPLLVSLNTLRSFKCQIDFGVGKLKWQDSAETMLKMTPDKHLSFQWYPVIGTEKEILIDEESSDVEMWTKSQLEKLHFQLGHADVGVMQRILRLAGGKVPEGAILEITRHCGCQINTGVPQPPRITKYISTCPGDVVAMDVYYPTGNQSEPAVICGFVNPLCVIEVFDQPTSTNNNLFLDYLLGRFHGCTDYYHGR